MTLTAPLPSPPAQNSTAGERKVFSYLRFSTPEQALGDSRRRQVEAAQAWAASRGLALDDELSDEGISGFRGANLTAEAALGSFVRAVDAGLVPEGSILVVESLDRLSRDRLLYAQHLLMSLLLKGITVVSLADGREYSRESVTEQPLELIASLLVFMRANEESDMKARRLRASWEAKRAKAGRDKVRMTSTAPAWLAPEGTGWAVLEERADVVRRIFRETAEGLGQIAIAKRLTQDGPAPWEGGRVWHRTYVRKILDSPAVIGTLVPHVTERLDGGRRVRRPLPPIEGYYPPIIDAETWARARAQLGTRGAPKGLRGRHAAEPVRSLLARLARCPLCDSTMTRVSKGPKGGQGRLVCVTAKAGGQCEYRSVPQAEVEGAIFSQAHTLVDAAPPSSEGEAAARATVRGLEAERWAVEDELDELVRRRRSLTTAERGTRASLYEQLELLRAEHEAAVQHLVDSGSAVVRNRLNRLAALLAEGPQNDLGEVNRALSEAVTAVTVDYVSGTLRFHWRHSGTSEITYRYDWE